MANISVAQTSFVGGEISPALHARTDISRYQNSVRKMLNMFPHPHGGVSNRGGTQFIGDAKYKDKYCRLIPFQFSVIQSYILEFGHQYIRFYKDGGRIVEGDKTISAISNASQGVVTCNSHGYNNGDWVILYAEGITGLYDKIIVVSDKTTNDFKIKDIDGNYIDTTLSGSFTSGTMNKIYEISSAYVEGDLWLLKFSQSADTMYLTHPTYPIKKLTRTGHTNWTIVDVTIGPKISAPQSLARSAGTGTGSSYVVTAVSTEGEESVASNAVSGGSGDTFTWTAPATGTVRYYNVYKDDNGGGVYGWIGYAYNPTFKDPSTVTLIPDTSKVPPVANNPFSGSGNYPGCSTFFEQRLVFARLDNKPQTLFGSVIGGYENFNKSAPIKDDDSYEFTMNATQMNEIRWLVPLEMVLVGTSGGEFRMTNGSASDAITPLSVDLKRQSNWGVDHLQPIVIGNTVVFLEGSRANVRDFSYNRDTGYTGSDLSVFATHLFKGYALLEWCYQKAPDGIIWGVRNDGKLVAMTYMKEHDVWGWHQHDTDGYFESIASISVDEGVDEVWTVVKRTIDGVTRRYIEKFMSRLNPDADFNFTPDNAYFVDCGLSYDGWNYTTSYELELQGSSDWDRGDSLTLVATGDTPFLASHVGRYFKLRTSDWVSVIVKCTAYTSSSEITVTPWNKTVPESLRNTPTTYYALMATTVSGLGHLEGKAVSVLADGNVLTGKTVTNGTLTLGRPFAKVHAGLGYVSEVETLDFEYATETGTVQDKERQILSAVLRFENTRQLFIGPDSDNLNEIPFRTTEDLGEPITLYTGDKSVEVNPPVAERQGRVLMRITDPVPTTILSIIARMTHGEK